MNSTHAHEKELIIIAIYLLIKDYIDCSKCFLLYREIFLIKNKISERTINDEYYIGNGTRWRRNMAELIERIKRSDVNGIFKKIIKLIEMIEFPVKNQVVIIKE